MLAAAAEIVKKGLARITLLGKPSEVQVRELPVDSAIVSALCREFQTCSAALPGRCREAGAREHWRGWPPSHAHGLGMRKRQAQPNN